MKFFKKVFCFPLLFLIFLSMSTSLFSWTDNYGTNAPSNSAVDLDLDGTFSLLYGGKGVNIKGDMAATGDSVLTTTTNAWANVYIKSKYTLSDSTFGTHTDSRKRNSSEATLNLPSYVKGEYITFAGLFWQGSIHEKKSSGLTTAQVDSYVKGWNQVTFKTPDGNYYSLTADLTKKDTTSKAYHFAYKDDSNYRWNYAAYVNVTDLVKDTYVDNNSIFTVGHILTTAGQDFSSRMYFKHEPQTNGLWPSDSSIIMGLAGGWSLIVVYNIPQEDTEAYSKEDLRTVSIYDGYENFAIWVTYDPLLVSVDISNFLTPKNGTLNSRLLIFAGEGDYGITGDVLQIYNPNTSSYDTIANTLNPSGNQFNSSYSNLGTNMSTKEFRNGVDLDIYDVSSSMGYGQTNTSINFGVKRYGSSADQIFPQVLAFSTQLYEPQLCYDYSIKQDGNYLNIDYDEYPIARLDSTISTSDIEITVYLRNQDADFSAEGIALSSDIDKTLFNQTGDIYTSNKNGSTLFNRGTPTSALTLCAYDENGDNSISNNGCTDGHNIRKGIGSLDDQEYIYAKWKITPNTSGATDINTSLGLTLSYYITAEGDKIVYNDYPLGSKNIPLCSPSSSTYKPTYGHFNVIRTGSTTNNLFTQISRKPFDASIIYDSNPTDANTYNAPDTNLKTTVLAEIIDMDAFADIEASCANPDSSLTDLIYTPIDFTTSNYQTVIPTQTADYYDFAVKNASFRLWYFADDEGSLIENWTANTTNNYKTLTGISGLYQSSTHTLCASQCSDDTTVSCFECIKDNYAYPICSRDNFSVRPESFDLRIYDVNQTNATTDNSNIDLSKLKGFDPNSSATTDRIDLAAGYDYRYDMSATGHDNNDAVPGYTRYFNSGSSDYNSTMYWDTSSSVVTGCNDTDNVNMSFYIKNGTMTNEKRNLAQVGDYRINIIDKSWTAVDWSNNSHHTAANGFSTSSDCVTSSDSSTTNSDGKYGCTITTDHGTVNGYTYQDHYLTFHPYKFGISNTKITLGLNNRDINTTDDFSNFVYMTDIGDGSSSDENMSVQLTTTIAPQGFDGSSLSNFVTGCYAKPIDVNISTSGLINPTLTYKYIIRDLNTSAYSSGSQTNPTSEDANITTTNSFFAKSMNGTLDNTIKLNFDRDKNAVANPEDVNFTTITVSDPRTGFNALLENNQTAEGNASINQNITYYFGRTAAKKTKIICDELPCTSGENGELDVLIYYEVYCYATVNSNTCDRTLLPQLDSRYMQKVDSRWYINLNHTESSDGNLTATYENAGSVTVPTITNLNDYTKNSAHTYSGANGLPYTATMNSTVPNWLIYDEDDSTATTNKHIVLFQANTEWTGQHETNTTTNTEKVRRVNRRTMW